jgi:hypothetical protein
MKAIKRIPMGTTHKHLSSGRALADFIGGYPPNDGSPSVEMMAQWYSLGKVRHSCQFIVEISTFHYSATIDMLKPSMAGCVKHRQNGFATQRDE